MFGVRTSTPAYYNALSLQTELCLHRHRWLSIYIGKWGLVTGMWCILQCIVSANLVMLTRHALLSISIGKWGLVKGAWVVYFFFGNEDEEKVFEQFTKITFLLIQKIFQPNKCIQ